MNKTSKKIISFGLLFVAVFFYSLGPSLLSFAGISENSPYFPTLLIGLELFVWIAATLVTCLLIRAIIWDGIIKQASGWETPDLIKSLSDVTIILIASLLAANVVFGQNVIAFITALGAVGVVLSFGIKELISDLMTGLAINLEHSFSIGDWISINDGQAGTIYGRVTQINWRTTHLIDDNQSYFVVPNREIGNSTVTIYSSPTKLYRFSVTVELDYEVEVSAAKRILLSAAIAATKHEHFVETPEPSVIISGFPAAGVAYTVRFWLDMSGEVSIPNAKDILLQSILRHLRLRGLGPSFAKLELYESKLPDMLAVAPSIDLKKIMARIPLLQALNQSELSYITENSVVSPWSPNEKVISQGDDGETMFVVLEGVLNVFIKNEYGTEMRVGQVQAGDLFGEMSLLTGEPRSATILAISPVKTIEITKDIFSKLLKERPELGATLSDVMSERQLQSQTALSTQQRESQRIRTSRQVYSKIRKFFGTAS